MKVFSVLIYTSEICYRAMVDAANERHAILRASVELTTEIERERDNGVISEAEYKERIATLYDETLDISVHAE